MLFFTLIMTSLADVAVLRDGAQEVDAMGRIGTAVPDPEGAHAAPQPATRKEPAAVDKAVARSHSEWTASAVLSQALLDPFALCMLLLICAYVALHQLVPHKAQEKQAARVLSKPPGLPEPDAQSQCSMASRRSSNSGKGRAPDRFALVVNQKLTRLESVDEVLDFALQSAETGRTDIVNCVTAIHRSAKLMQNKPQVERIRVGQDPRLRKLLDQLQQFVQQQDSTPQILARAVGNTSWALAKLQFREDPDAPPILTTMQEVFVEHCQSFRPEELMNAVWAFAEMRRDKDSLQGEERVLLVAKAACRCLGKFPEFTLQQVVYLSWALARMASISAVKHDSSEVRAGLLEYTTKIVQRSRPALQHLTTKNLAMLSWAVASLHSNLGLVDDEGHVCTLLEEIAQKLATAGLRGFQPGEIASIVWALNKVNVRQAAFYTAFKTQLLTNGLRGYSTQDISTILCAFAKTEYGSDALYQLLGDRAQALANDFNRSEKVMVQWAYSQLPHLTAPKL